MIPKKAQEILDFWFKETPADKRFKKDEAFDKTIREKFLSDYELASQNEYDDWQDHTKAIRLFHRYPHRNKVLGRESTEEELAFLNEPNSSW